MKKILLYLWQLPQNLLGIMVVWASRAVQIFKDSVYWTECTFGVSLGNYIILYRYATTKEVRHEKGHQKQSKYLGWLYLIVIGLPSACGNLWDRMFHKKWSLAERERWYYNLIWEKWADKLGGVER